MNTKLNSEEIIELTHKMVALYFQASPEQTFGAWILSQYYNRAILDDMMNLRDFAGAQRTIDARYYLGGMLRSGTLNPEPLLEAVRTNVISEKTLQMLR